MSVSYKAAWTACAGVCAAGLLIAIPSAGAASGDLDSAFGVGGKVTSDIDGRGDFAVATAIQADGKIVAAGNSAPPGVFAIDFALARYHPDGTLDSGFAGDGTVLTDFGAPVDAASDVAVQPDGKIVAVGISAGDFALARYNPDGTLDSSFGVGGRVTTDFGGSDQANAVAIQQDGKVVAAGGGATDDFALARYEADGTLDPGFGVGGRVTTDTGFVHEVLVQPDGKIVAVGLSLGDFALARYNPNGTLDAAFGTGGRTTTDFGASDAAFGALLHPSGKITAGGGTGLEGTTADFALARYNADGTLDAGFGSGGKVTTDFDARSDVAFGVVLDLDGRITAVGGTAPVPNPGDFGIARYNADGSLDGGFGSGGKVTTDFGGDNAAFDAVLQPDGKVVAAGTNFGAGFADFALARYLDSTPTVPTCNGKPATIVGSAGDSTVAGTGDADVIVDLSGSNKIRAKGGNDTICTGPGNDEISGAGGDDWVDAGDGRNSVEGNGGQDRLMTGSGNDQLEGNGGNDTLTGGSGADNFLGGGGTDTATDFTPTEGDTKTSVEVVL